MLALMKAQLMSSLQREIEPLYSVKEARFKCLDFKCLSVLLGTKFRNSFYTLSVAVNTRLLFVIQHSSELAG